MDTAFVLSVDDLVAESESLPGKHVYAHEQLNDERQSRQQEVAC